MNIAIIGAGITGCLLSELLNQQDCQITLFEKSRGCGGRASTKRTDWGQFDHGATIVPAKDPCFISFMQQLCEQNFAQQWPKSISYAEKFYNQWQVSNHQPQDRQFFVFVPKMNFACKQWVKHAKLHTQSLVTAIRHQQHKGWQIKIGDTWSQQHFDKVVLTTPWPQSQALMHQSDLPIDTSKLAQRWTSCWSVAMQLGQNLAQLNPLIYAKDAAIQTLVRDSAKPGRAKPALPETEIWLAQLDNALSDKLSSSAKEQAIAIAQQTACEVLGIDQTDIVAKHAHYWRYARPASGQTPLGLVALENLGFYAAGDWSYGASVEAAFNTARALQQHILS